MMKLDARYWIPAFAGKLRRGKPDAGYRMNELEL
jgi:hypothetical protein